MATDIAGGSNSGFRPVIAPEFLDRDPAMTEGMGVATEKSRYARPGFSTCAPG